MVTEIDSNAIKTRIQTILKNNILLYNNKVPNKNNVTLINEVYVGLPDGYVWESLPMPYICISNASPDFETDKPFGAVTGTIPNASYSTSYHVVNYIIVIMIQGPKAALVEQYLDAFHKLVKETLKSNFQFANPVNGLNDLNIEQTILTTSKYVDGGSRKGTTINGIVINCQVKAVTG